MDTATAFAKTLASFRALNPEAATLLTGDIYTVVNRLLAHPDDQVLEALRSSAAVELRAVRKSFDAIDIGNQKPNQLADQARRLYFLFALRAATHRFGGEHPLRNHWIPRCYLKQFAPHNNLQGKHHRGVVRMLTSVPTGELRASSVKERRFIHSTVEGDSYYSPQGEHFFGLIEAAYSSFTVNPNQDNGNKRAYAAVAGLMLTVSLAVRNRSALPGRRRTLNQFLKASVTVFDALPIDHLYLHKATSAQLFSTDFIGRHLRLVSGDLTGAYPLSRNLLLIGSTGVLDRATRIRMASGARRSYLRHAKSGTASVFGLTEEQLTSLNGELKRNLALAS